MKRAFFLFALVAMLAVPLAGLAADMPNTMKDAKVGEWALYQMMGPMQQKQTVIAVDAKSVTIRIDIMMNGKTVNSTSNKMLFSAMGSMAAGSNRPDMKMGKATVTVKGQSLDCITAQVSQDGKTFVTYISTEVPVYGMVKSTMNGKPIMELIDFGGK